ncbi:Do family serine endopeptidase [Helicobacter sp. 11S02596-1]|uniref:Do family serine endopeptidase n=1 Tax=Helicobacter sp. 11S02596-1 TaxID=1476194 RepID=UPI000BA4FF9A|nr:Do family serine endopeptidase [Helicobacter sp. 11S02596-1]PAF42374.1 serine protease [Helicobacter sp. 11S02596-1]
MKYKILISAVLATALSLNAFSIADMPSVAKRVGPDISSNAVYSYNASVKDATQAVVNISTQKKIRNQITNNPMFNDPFFQQFFGDLYNQIPKDRVERALGSGVIISPDGYIVTNNHVIDGADKITVTLPGSTQEYSATLVGADPDGDLAVIRINKQGLPFIKFSNSSDLLVGDVVFAIGNPFGVGETVTQGIVSALNKNGMGINNYENFIQTDASINPGNSGGALIDSRGALVGINTAIISRTGGNHGIGFAIPSNMVKSVVTQLVKNGKIERGFLGVGIQDVSNDLRGTYAGKQGAVVISLEKDSPAKKAGLMVWDLITEVDGKKINDAAELKNIIGSLHPNQKITLKYIRDKKEHTATITLAERKNNSKNEVSVPKDNMQGQLSGLKVETLTPQIRQKYKIPNDINGVIVSSVAENSAAEDAGFMQGDIISQIEDITIKSTADFTNALNKYKGKTKRILVYGSNGIKTIVTK